MQNQTSSIRSCLLNTFFLMHLLFQKKILYHDHLGRVLFSKCPHEILIPVPCLGYELSNPHPNHISHAALHRQHNTYHHHNTGLYIASHLLTSISLKISITFVPNLYPSAQRLSYILWLNRPW